MFTTSKCLYLSFSVEPLLVLIEYVPYGDLLGYVRKSRGLNDTYYKDPDIKPQTSLTSQQLIKFAWQVADGMSYLSSRSVSASTLKEFYVAFFAKPTLRPLVDTHGLKDSKFHGVMLQFHRFVHPAPAVGFCLGRHIHHIQGL